MKERRNPESFAAYSRTFAAVLSATVKHYIRVNLTIVNFFPPFVSGNRREH